MLFQHGININKVLKELFSVLRLGNLVYLTQYISVPAWPHLKFYIRVWLVIP